VPRWDIDPAGVRGVVTRTAERAGGFQGQYEAYLTNVNSAAQTSQSGVVSGAVGAFFTAHEQTMPNIAKQAGASLDGAVNATVHYLNGDNDMALTAQRNAYSTPVPQLPQAGSTEAPAAPVAGDGGGAGGGGGGSW
jgi:Family of unknown function (DUF6507)